MTNVTVLYLLLSNWKLEIHGWIQDPHKIGKLHKQNVQVFTSGVTFLTRVIANNLAIVN